MLKVKLQELNVDLQMSAEILHAAFVLEKHADFARALRAVELDVVAVDVLEPCSVGPILS